MSGWRLLLNPGASPHRGSPSSGSEWVSLRFLSPPAGSGGDRTSARKTRPFVCAAFIFTRIDTKRRFPSSPETLRSPGFRQRDEKDLALSEQKPRSRPQMKGDRGGRLSRSGPDPSLSPLCHGKMEGRKGQGNHPRKLQGKHNTMMT